VSDTLPAWDDPDAFHQLLTRAGWRWAGVLRWLGVPPDTGFFQVATADRQRAAEHLGRLAIDRRFAPDIGR